MHREKVRERKFNGMLKLSVVKPFPCVLMFPIKRQRKIKLHHLAIKVPVIHDPYPVKPLCSYDTFLA